MFPPSQGINLDLEALSGISGAISIACWVVVFSPQIIENFRRGSADGLSIVFLVVWLLGDLFNIIGAVLQGVLPTMIILAVYYTLADIVLVCQVFYYRGFTLSDKTEQVTPNDPESEPLLGRAINGSTSSQPTDRDNDSRRPSFAELGRHISNLNVTQLPPTRPLSSSSKPHEGPATKTLHPSTAWQTFLFNTASIVLVCGAGVVGWWIGNQSKRSRHGKEGALAASYPQFDILGQVFGYLCTVFYLGSRVPQLLLNFRRKSTEGVSLLFFLFACLGNLTYTMSVFAYSPVCARRDDCAPGEAASIYGRYIMVNLSWIIGSAGTLLLDLVIFWQFFLYQQNGDGAIKPGTTPTLNGSPNGHVNGG